MTETLDITTYNPFCQHYDEFLGVCGRQDGHLLACRQVICPKEKELN